MSAPLPMDRGRAFVQVLSCVLSRLVAANDALPDQGVVTKFHALRPPSINIKDYLERINKYSSCSPECFVLALVFIDRLIQRNALLLSSLNVHRVIITAVMLAAKFFDDQYFNNAYYAKVGGVPTVEVNALELEFLFSVNFSLHVTTELFEKYYSELANHMGVGVPPELMAHNTCDCASCAPYMGYSAEEVAACGMRSPEEMAAETLAAIAAQHAGAAAATAAAAVPASAAPAQSPTDAAMSTEDDSGDAALVSATASVALHDRGGAGGANAGAVSDISMAAAGGSGGGGGAMEFDDSAQPASASVSAWSRSSSVDSTAPALAPNGWPMARNSFCDTAAGQPLRKPHPSVARDRQGVAAAGSSSLAAGGCNVANRQSFNADADCRTSQHQHINGDHAKVSGSSSAAGTATLRKPSQ